MHALSQVVPQAIKVRDTDLTRSNLDQFESSFAKIIGARHAIAVDSPTTACRLALETVGVGQGEEVITSPYSSTAAAEAILSLGARPAFVDVEEYSLNINSRLIAGAVTDKTKAILAVHTAGLPADIPSIHQIAGMHNLRVVEDATHAFPAEYRGVMVGGASDFTCFGLAASGVACTNNNQWAEQCRLTPLRMNEGMAGIALVQLSQAESIWTRRTEIARRYNHAFEPLPELQIPADRFDCEHAWCLYMLRVNFEQLRIDRAEFVEELRNRNIDADMHFVPLHVHPSYRGKFGCEPDDFHVAYREYLREVSLPIQSKMSDQDVEGVIRGVKDVVGEFRV